MQVLELSSMDKSLSLLLAMVQGSFNHSSNSRSERLRLQNIWIETLSAPPLKLSAEASTLRKNLFRHQNADPCENKKYPDFGNLVCDAEPRSKASHHRHLGYVVSDQEELFDQQYNIMKEGNANNDNKLSYRLYPQMSQARAAVYVLLGLFSPCFVKSWYLQPSDNNGKSGLLTEQLLTVEELTKVNGTVSKFGKVLLHLSVQLASQLFGITDSMSSWWDGNLENLDIGFRKITTESVPVSDLMRATAPQYRDLKFKKNEYMPVFMQHSSSRFQYENFLDEKKQGLGYITQLANDVNLLGALVQGALKGL